MNRGEKHRQLGDPHNISKRGKAASMRKGRYDGSFTPTEQRTKDRLMRQFLRSGDGSGSGNTYEYVTSPVWCEEPGCNRLNGSHEH